MSPTGFDLSLFRSAFDFPIFAAIYNRLVEWPPDTDTLKPSLAERWAISEDGRTYTFYLRRDIQFHTTPWFKPTRLFNAEDVKFSFERMRNRQMPFQHPIDFIERISIPSPDTIIFTLKTPYAPFLADLAMFSASIASAEYAEILSKSGDPAQSNRLPIGTGPFIFSKYLPDESIYFKGNPHYWKPADVKLSQLIFKITPDPLVRTKELQKNECQVIYPPSPVDIARLKQDPNIRVLSHSTYTSFGHLAYNTMHKPLDDGRVRRALDMAIDKQSIIDKVYEGNAQIAVTPIVPSRWADPSVQDTPRDSQQAQALLAQAGYPNGLTLSLYTFVIPRPEHPNSKLTAEMIQSDWKKIGVTAKIVALEWGEYLRSTRSGAHDTVLSGCIAENSDPGLCLDAMLSCRTVNSQNQSRWCYPRFDDVLQKAVQTTDEAQRLQLYFQAQRIFKQEQPLTPIAYPVLFSVIRREVTGFKIHPQGPVFWGVGLQ